MEKKKELIIMVPGAKFAKSVIRPFQRIILYFYKITHIYKPIYTNYIRIWKENFKEDGKECIWLHWGRGISPISKYFAVKRLVRLIEKYKNTRNINIIGISLGGEIALEASRYFSKGEVSKIILICSTNEIRKVNFRKTKIINVYSPFDIFASISAKVLAPLHGGTRLIGKNVKNIVLPKITHEQFCEGAEISSGKFKGIRINKFVEKYLK